MGLIVKNLDYQYKNDDFVLQNINLQVSKGNCLCIQGYNGSGKTTLLKLLAGLLVTETGTIYYDDFSVESKYYKSLMAYIPPEPYVFEMLTGFEHAYLCIDLWEIKEDKEYLNRFLYLCQELRVTEHLKKKLCECSYGTKYKIYLATMLAREPKLILMDEPLTSMDNDSRKFCIRYLKKKLPEITIIFTSHQEEIINQLSTDNCEIKNKTIIKGEEKNEKLL